LICLLISLLDHQSLRQPWYIVPKKNSVILCTKFVRGGNGAWIFIPDAYVASHSRSQKSAVDKIPRGMMFSPLSLVERAENRYTSQEPKKDFFLPNCCGNVHSRTCLILGRCHIKTPTRNQGRVGLRQEAHGFKKKRSRDFAHWKLLIFLLGLGMRDLPLDNLCCKPKHRACQGSRGQSWFQFAVMAGRFSLLVWLVCFETRTSQLKVLDGRNTSGGIFLAGSHHQDGLAEAVGRVRQRGGYRKVWLVASPGHARQEIPKFLVLGRFPAGPSSRQMRGVSGSDAIRAEEMSAPRPIPSQPVDCACGADVVFRTFGIFS
jgi:hypothetical protein